MKIMLWIILWIVVLIALIVGGGVAYKGMDKEDRPVFAVGIGILVAATLLYRHVANFIDQLPD